MKVGRIVALAVFAACLSAAEDRARAGGSNIERRVYVTRRTDAPPRIDGRLDDSVWNAVPWAGEFIAREPVAGVPPTGQTAFKILYDDENLYFACRAYDPDPERVSNILAER